MGLFRSARSAHLAVAAAALLASACTLQQASAPPAGPGPEAPPTPSQPQPPVAARCERTLMAEVVALEQAIVLNRYGAFNPSGMLYALRRDVVFAGHPHIADGTPVTEANLRDAPGHVRLRSDKRPRPIVLRANEGDCLEVRFHNLLAPRQAPGASGDSVYGGRVPAHRQDAIGTTYNPAPGGQPTGRALVDDRGLSKDPPPFTRAAAFHVNGLDRAPVSRDDCPQSSRQRVWLCNTDGDNVGLNQATVRADGSISPPDLQALQNQAGQVLPGQSALYRWHAFREGTYFAYSTAASVGGEGDGGQLGAGLFGAVNVQPRGSMWYRSQVSHADLRAAARAPAAGSRHPWSNLDYDNARHGPGAPPALRGRPILAMLDGLEIVHTDINAIVVLRGTPPDRNDTTSPDRACSSYAWGNSCGESYREFTVVMHDEVKAVQAFPELDEPEDENAYNPMAAIRDNMGINYGVAGMGAMVVARNRRTGPVKNCPECRGEEFFLSSWANGDPALVLQWDEAGRKPVGAMYPDDPSNVHHSYLNDPVRFRNLLAGPKETHVFHLHAHQWVQDPSQPGSTYLDSQTISPGATFSYEVEFGGSGNLNLTPGDSIFHCHLYPHFAQGMWELWRVHDVFEDGSAGRRLPDAEVEGGTESPALVPLPGSVLALMPTEEFKGYPFYVAGEPGHRPPQPPLDMDKAADGGWIDGGLPRHVLTGWDGSAADRAAGRANLTLRALSNQQVLDAALAKGGTAAQINARRVFEDIQARRGPQQAREKLMAGAEEWAELGAIRLLDPEGEPAERRAMDFHAGTLAGAGFTPTGASAPDGHWGQETRGYRSERAAALPGQPAANTPAVFRVNGKAPVPGAPFADPCRKGAPQREYRAGVIQTELTVNRHGWFDPQARILTLEQDIAHVIDPGTRDRLPEPLFFRANSGDCIDFKHSNFAPNGLALDDFQVYTPIDTIGQHIHLVKFDVTSSDGSGNGWNYEDGTFSAEEVRERIHAYNKAAEKNGNAPLRYKAHPLATALEQCTGEAGAAERCNALKARLQCPANAESLPLHEIAHSHPFCGAQRTVQRWYADPILDRGQNRNNKDLTLRTVFTHDHFGPSSHQQHGLYAALVIEPSNSLWLDIGHSTLDWDKLCRGDAGERAKLLGGADLGRGTGRAADSACRDFNRYAGPAELRPPLRLREDGGPTSARANIVSPHCLGDEGARLDSNPLDPRHAGSTDLGCAKTTGDTRREYGLAFADFAILYNAALEPINPEKPDRSAIRQGERQVWNRHPWPLAISLEDPGTQLINYRNEPMPLRITERTADARRGGFNYRQKNCEGIAPAECTGDTANLFSTSAHAARDHQLATQPYGALMAPRARQLLAGTPLAARIDGTLAQIEQWRVDFSCALYSPGIDLARPTPACRIRNREPWRQWGDPATPILAAYEGDPLYLRLIQGAQEAQHVFAMTGAKWLREPDSPDSGYVNAQPLGISEHFEFNVPVTPVDATQTDSLYLSSSIDKVWDGVWGLLRAYGRKTDERTTDGSAAAPPAIGDARQWITKPELARLNDLKGGPVPWPVSPVQQEAPLLVCSQPGDERHGNVYQERLKFDISVVRACELRGNCGSPAHPSGLVLNERLDMHDPDAIVYVRNNHTPGQADGPSVGLDPRSNEEVLRTLKASFGERNDRRQYVRPIEPLVLRAAAGQCMEVRLRNHLPPRMNTRYADRSHNFMAMITDGFNVNELRMSTTVGLSAPLLSIDRLGADGANFGNNHRELSGDDPTADGPGTLVPACADPEDDSRCTGSSSFWYAGHFEIDADRKVRHAPVEFGAIPLSSFGDPIKHPMHGLVGALVIGPEGSRMCPQQGNAAEQQADSASYTSATLCDKDNKRLYRDFVVVMQDAVEARIGSRAVPNHPAAEEPDDYGTKAINYRSEPLWARRGRRLTQSPIHADTPDRTDFAGVLSSKQAGNNRCQAGMAPLAFGAGLHPCDPETPTFVASAGSQVRWHLVHPGGRTRQNAFALGGHDWNPYAFTSGSTQRPKTHKEATDSGWIIQGAYNGFGPLMASTLQTQAGGRLWRELEMPQDYLWRSQASFLFHGGMWGLLRATPPDSTTEAARP